MQFEWLAPYEITNQEILAKGGKSDASDWGSYGPLTYVELDKNANFDIINNQLKNFIQRKSSAKKSETFLLPMKDWRLYNEFANGKQTGGGRIEQVRMLSLIAWIILLIACINYEPCNCAQ